MEIGKHRDQGYALFCIGLALLACHELDAVSKFEWRLLPILSTFEDETGLAAFILLHIPIFAVVFWATGHTNKIIRWRSQVGVDLFLLAHGLIHFVLSDHALYEFEPPIETITVYGGALVGIIHLVLLFRSRP
jgi:Family of unknown function (DUF6713)